jgi:hypothetical protein
MDYSLLVGVVTRHFEVKARPSTIEEESSQDDSSQSQQNQAHGKGQDAPPSSSPSFSSASSSSTSVAVAAAGGGSSSVTNAGVSVGGPEPRSSSVTASPRNSLRQSIQQQQQQLQQQLRTASDTTASVTAASVNTSANQSSAPSRATTTGNTTTATSDNPLSKDEEGAIGAEVVQAPGTYYFGIIDILQEWNFAKKVERFYKVYLRFNAADGISAVPPDAYQGRFMTRVANDIFDLGESANASGNFTDSRISSSPSLQHRNFSSSAYGGFSQASARNSVRRKSRGTEDASICVLTESPRMSLFADDLDYAEYAY